MGETVVMKEASLEELVEQCTSQKVAVRVPAYRTLTKKCTADSEDVVWSDYASMDDTQKTLANIKADLLNETSDISYEAAGVCGCLLANESFLSLINPENEIEILEILIKAIKETKEKKVLNRSLWSLAKSRLNRNVYVTKNEEIVATVIGIINKKGHDTSAVVVHESLQVIKSLLTVVPDEMGQGAKNWFPIVFSYMFHDAGRVRAAAFATVNAGKNILEKTNNDEKMEILKMIIPDLKTHHCKQMNRLVGEECIDILKEWRIIVKMLGKELHPGTSLINGLLEVVEKGFKSSKPEIRVDAFKCWEALIDNFSLDTSVLSHSKRLKLLLAPLKANNAKTEEIAHAKLLAWWHLVCKLGKKAAVNFDLVVVPLLRFCFGCGSSTSGTVVGLAERNLIMSGAPASPGRKFSGLHVTCAEILAQVLSKGVDIAGLQAYVFTIPVLEEPVVTTPTMFIRYHQLLLNCTSEAVQSLNSQERKQYLLGVFLFQSVLAHLRVIITLDTNKKDCVEPVKELFNTISSLERQCCPGDSQSQFTFKFLEMVIVGNLALPKTVLNSRQYHITTDKTMRDMMNGTLSNHLIHQLCRPSLLHFSTVGEGFFTLWLAVLANGKPSVGKLWFLQSVMKELAYAAPVLCPDHPIVLVRLWSSVVSQLIEHIEETQMIDQGDGSEHDWSCIFSVLLFPLVQSVDALSSAENHIYQLISTNWNELWIRFIDLTPLTPTAEPNSEVEYVAHTLVNICNEKLTAPPDIHAAAYRLMADVLAVLTEKLRYSELGKNSPKLVHSPARPKKKPHPLHNLAACIELFGIILRRVLHMVSNERQHVASKLCEAITNVFKGVQQTKLVFFLVAHVVGPLSESLQVNPAARFSYDVEKKFISMFKSFSTLIDEHFGKTHTGDQLTKLVPLFIVGLKSSNKNIKVEACRLWKSSFSSTKFNIPPTLFELLKECGLPPASLIDLHDKTEESLNLNPKENIPARQAASSFMREAESEGKPQDTANLRSPKVDTSKSGRISHDTSASKEKNKIKVNIEDMREEEFVKVMSPKLKKRVLTEHQIERMTERRCDIPALYSELSQAISQDMLPSQFASQSSFEESAIQEPVGSLLKKEDKVQNRINDPEDIVKTFQSETRNTSNDDLGVQELSFSGKFPSESKETECEDEEDELVKELQVESQRKKLGKGLESKNADTKGSSVGDKTEQTKKKQDQEVCEVEQFELKRKNISVSSDDEEPSYSAEISENAEGVEVANLKNKVKHKAQVLDVRNEKQVDTQSKEIDKCSDEEMKNINDKSEKEVLTIKADNIRTYSGKKKKDSITRRYGNGDSDYTDEDLNEELRKTSLMLQKSLNESNTEDSCQTFTPLESNRRKMQAPVKKTLNDVRRSLKGTALSNKDTVNTSKIDSPPPSLKQIKEQRISFKEVAVSPSVIRDEKLMKKIPEVKLTDEAVMIKQINNKHLSDTDSEEEIPNSQVNEEPNSHRSVFGHGSRASPVTVLKDRCVEEDSDKEAMAKEGSQKYVKAKRKCSLIAESDTISASPDKRKKSGDKNHHSLMEKQNSSDESVVILEEKVKEQEMGKQMSSQRKKETLKQQRDGEDFSGRNIKKVSKSPAEILRKNSQNSTDSQGSTDRPNNVTSQSTPPKVTRSGRKIVAPNRDMPEPMTPPGASSSKKRIRSQESIVVSYVGDNVPKITETLPIPLNSMPEKKSVQKKITDMFSRDDQRIPNREFNENFEDGITLPEMEEISDSQSENDSDMDEYAPGEQESSSSPNEEESASITADIDDDAGGADQQVCSGQMSRKILGETKNELAQEPDKTSPAGQFPRKFCGSPSKNVQVVDSLVRLSKDQEVASHGDKDEEDNINYVLVLNESLKIAKISKELESASNGGVCDKINTGRNQEPDDYSQKNMAKEVSSPSKVAKCPLATKDQAEKTSDESSSFECGQIVDEHLNEVSRKSSYKELNDSSMNKTGNIRDGECITGIEKDGKEIARNSEQNSEKRNDFDKSESTVSEQAVKVSTTFAKKHLEKSVERELEKCDNEDLEELCLKDCQVNAKASGEFGLNEFENRFKDCKERYVNTSDKEALEAFRKVKKSVKASVRYLENFGAKDSEKDKVSELVKVTEKDLESVSFKYIEKTNLGTNLPARQWEEELSPERPSKSRLNLAVSTPERQKKKGIAKYAGSRAAMLVAVAKKNIKNRGASEGESPSKSVIGGEASRYRNGGSPIRRSGTGHFSPTSTPPNRKRKYSDRDSGRPWAKHEPSPGASPSTSILKKKTVLDDSFSRETPSPKRRCVRFTDPLVSDRVEIPPSPKTLKGIRAQKRLDMTKAASPIKDIDFPSPSKESQEADSPAFLDCSQPLYPALITCQDKIDQVAHLLTSSALVPGLLTVFEERGVFTVGHLSQLTEADIYKLPVRAPKISATVKVLKKYEEKLYREGKKSSDPLMDEVEAQLREVLGEVDREDKENLQPNNNFHETRKFVDGEDNLENMEAIEDRPSRDTDVPQAIDDIHGMDDDITPLDASPEDVQPEMIKAICKKAAESPQFLESFADHLDLDAKESLFTHLIKRLHYQFVIDCFYRYLKTKNTGDNT